MVRQDGSVDCIKDLTNAKAQFRVENVEQPESPVVRFQNVKFETFLTITRDQTLELVVTTTKEKNTENQFEVAEQKQGVTLKSLAYSGKYIGAVFDRDQDKCRVIVGGADITGFVLTVSQGSV
jgi:hypothetical protein